VFSSIWYYMIHREGVQVAWEWLDCIGNDRLGCTTELKYGEIQKS